MRFMNNFQKLIKQLVTNIHPMHRIGEMVRKINQLEGLQYDTVWNFNIRYYII